MIRRATVLAVVLAGGCRGEAAAPSEPPKAAEAAKTAETAEPAESAAKAREAESSAEGTQTKEASVTTTPPSPEPAGPPLAAEAVVPHFQRWWKAWSPEHLATNPLQARLDELVAAGGTVKAQACDVLADHVEERAPTGSPELLYGTPAALRGRTDRCWWLHHDGMMGAGLGAALASDGKVLAVWVVLEG